MKTLTGIDVDDSHLLTSLAALTAWILAGRAGLTLYNQMTGVRFTFHFKVASVRTRAGGFTRAHGVGPWEVSVRRGVAGGGCREMKLGLLRRFEHTRLGTRLAFTSDPRDEVKPGDAEVKAMYWLVRRINQGQELPEVVKAWRPDECGRCGAELESDFRLIGFGPTCCKHMGIDARAILALQDENQRIERVRQMVYAHQLTVEDAIFARLLPTGSVARDYLDAHTRRAA